VEELCARVAHEVDDRTLAVMVSSVLFETAEIVPGLDGLAAVCEAHGAPLLVDAYHHLNVVPFDLRGMGLERAFVTGGGYKYCQLGEGSCFLRVPSGTRLRPILTGWFAEFDRLDTANRQPGAVSYPSGAAAFAGATYDPTSHYRAAAVFDFHAAQGLTPDRLRAISVHQVGVLEHALAALDLDPSRARVLEMAPDRRAGFLAVRSPHASELVRGLRQNGVSADSRGDILRLGPAPYVSDEQLQEAVAKLSRVITGV
jgi:kynureninase